MCESISNHRSIFQLMNSNGTHTMFARSYVGTSLWMQLAWGV